LKTQDFIRVRVGIQPEHLVTDASNFVLENFSKKESETIEKILDAAADAVRTIIIDGVGRAMAEFN